MDTYKKLPCPFCDTESDCWLTDAENTYQFTCTTHGEFDIYSVAYRKIKRHPVIIQSLTEELKTFSQKHPGQRLYIGFEKGRFYSKPIPI